MTPGPDDPKWAEFKPLWVELQRTEKPLLVAGGYGLYLKEYVARTPASLPMIVPFEQWRDITPRATKDVDLVVGLDLIADGLAQAAAVRALVNCGFKVTEEHPRWQFKKDVAADTMLVEFHTPLPDVPHPHLAMDKRKRVKHKPSLGEFGIHGHQNAEAVGCELHPHAFEIEGVRIEVPNPLTWSVMKLTAMKDRRERSEADNRAEGSRSRVGVAAS